METTFCSTYEMCLYVGIIEIYLNFILFMISNYVEFLSNFRIDFKAFQTKDILIFIVMIFLKFFYNLCNYLTIKLASEFHFLIIIVIGELTIYIKDLISNNEKLLFIIFTVVSLIFILFMTLVFIEIIEINCFQLQLNTKRNISKRAQNIDTIDERRISIGDYLFYLDGENDDREGDDEENGNGDIELAQYKKEKSQNFDTPLNERNNK